MSLRQMMMALSSGAIVPSVTSPVTILFSDDTGPNNVGIIFNDVLQGVGAPNNMVKRHKLVYTVMGDDDAGSPIDHTGEWTPISNDGSLFEVACDSLSMGVWSTEPAAVGVFTSLDTADLLWNVTRSGGKGRTAGTTQVIGSFTIREIADTGNSTTFTVDVTNTQTDP